MEKATAPFSRPHRRVLTRTDGARRRMQASTWNRKALLRAYEGSPSLLRPFAVLALDLALFGAGSALALLATSLALKLVGTFLVTAGIVRLFMVGHDACHGSFFRNKTLNAVCAFGKSATTRPTTASTT
jgi:fatty acid desaturase